MGNLIVVVASMEREVPAVLRRGHRASPSYSVNDREGDSVVVWVTGVGKDRTLAAMKGFSSHPPKPDFILSLGFAGALVGDLHTGDLVLSPRLYSTEEKDHLVCDGHLLALAQEILTGIASPRHVVADSVTVSGMALTSEKKRRLASTNGAWVANMEDYWVAKAASEMDIPFLSVRAVLDTFRQEIPSFVASLGNRGLFGQLLRVIPNLAARPGNIAHLITLGRQAKVARDSLAAVAVPILNRMTAVGTATIQI